MIRWEPVPSLPFRQLMKAVSFSVFISCIDSKLKNETMFRSPGHYEYRGNCACFMGKYLLSKVYDIHVDFFFLEPLCHFDQLQMWKSQTCMNFLCTYRNMEQKETHFFFIILHWTANKHNNAHLVVFPLSVLQGQLQ